MPPIAGESRRPAGLVTFPLSLTPAPAKALRLVVVPAAGRAHVALAAGPAPQAGAAVHAAAVLCRVGAAAACALRARIKAAPTGLRAATFPALPRHARRHVRQSGRRACLRGLRAKFGAGGRTAQAPGHAEYPEPSTCICLQGGAPAAGRAVLESRRNRVHRKREHVREQGLPEHRAEADLRDARPAGRPARTTLVVRGGEIVVTRGPDDAPDRRRPKGGATGGGKAGARRP